MAIENTQDFIEALVKIEKHENGMYGYNPFYMASMDADGKLTLCCLNLDDSFQCYICAKKMVREGAVKLYLSMDFPAMGDIEHDFVVVFTVDGREIESVALPYNPTTGEMLEPIQSSVTLLQIQGQFETIALN